MSKHIRLSAVCDGWFARPLPAYRARCLPVTQEEPATPEQIAAWRARWDATCSDRIAATLTALERDFAPRCR